MWLIARAVPNAGNKRLVLRIRLKLFGHEANVKKNIMRCMTLHTAFQTQTPWLLHFAMVSMLCLPVVLVGCQTVVTAPNGTIKDPEQAARTRTAIAAEYIKKGDLDAAKRHLEQALTADPRSAEANNMMGILLQQEGSPSNVKRAEDYYKRAITLKEDFAQAHNNYGVYLSANKRYAEAMKQFEVAGATLGYDGRASALENLGRTALMMDNPSRAQAAFEQATNADRNLAVSHFELAELYLDQGKVSLASARYQQYLKLVGGEPKAARALWLGMRLARLQQDGARLQDLADRLQRAYPDSTEYKHYLMIRQTPGAAWK
jgi:type IV pilus assembly protein PilF